jgi:hypothetical protein
MKINCLLTPVKIWVTTLICFGLISTSYGFDLQGPTSVCACGSDKTPCQNVYTVSNYGINDRIEWRVYDMSAPNGPLTEYSAKDLAAGSSFIINFNNSPGTSRVEVKIFWAGTYIQTKEMLVERYLADVQVANSGLIVFCSGNENVTIDQPDITACDFHYDFNYTSPSNFLMSGTNFYQTTSTGNTKNLVFNMQSPSSPSNGNAGLLYSTAKWTQGSLSQDRTGTTPIWVGSPSVSNGYVNGSSAGGMSYVPSGYANLSISQGGGTSYNWYVTNGSGSLSPTGPNCSVSFSGFVRVVIDVTNRCGGTSSWTFYLNQNSQYGGYSVYPNPARSNLSVDFATKELPDDLLTDVGIYDEKGKAVKSFDVKGAKKDKYFKSSKAVEFNVSDLKRGTYFLHVSYGENVNKSQVIIE